MPHIRLEILGSGTSQGVPVVACDCAVCTSSDPHDSRLRSSALLTVDGSCILIDAGPDLRQQLLRSKVHELEAVLLTHEHMDHVAGIDELRALNYRMQQPMDIHGNTATLSAVRRTFHYAFGPDRYPGVPDLRLHPIEQDRFKAGGVAFDVITVMHGSLPVLGFRHGPVAYITDAKSIAPDQMERLKDLRVLVINALRIKEHSTHLNLAEALELIAELAPERAVLTHISHLMGRHGDISATLPAGVQLGYDGLVLELES